MGDSSVKLMNNIFGIDFRKTPEENVNLLKNKWSSEKELELNVLEKEINICFDFADGDQIML